MRNVGKVFTNCALLLTTVELVGVLNRRSAMCLLYFAFTYGPARLKVRG